MYSSTEIRQVICAIEKACERFAFMKSLERHKEQQSNYERILRTLDSNFSEGTDSVNEIVVAY